MAVQPGADSQAKVRAAHEEFSAASAARDPERITACFADDAEMLALQGTFHGIDAIRGYYDWICDLLPRHTFAERGLGLRVIGSVVLYEGVQSGTDEHGSSFSDVPIMCVWEYDENAKIKRLAVYSDRWPIIQQSTDQMHGPMGFFARGFTKRVDESITEGLPPAE